MAAPPLPAPAAALATPAAPVAPNPLELGMQSFVRPVEKKPETKAPIKNTELPGYEEGLAQIMQKTAVEIAQEVDHVTTEELAQAHGTLEQIAAGKIYSTERGDETVDPKTGKKIEKADLLDDQLDDQPEEPAGNNGVTDTPAEIDPEAETVVLGDEQEEFENPLDQVELNDLRNDFARAVEMLSEDKIDAATFSFITQVSLVREIETPLQAEAMRENIEQLIEKKLFDDAKNEELQGLSDRLGSALGGKKPLQDLMLHKGWVTEEDIHLYEANQDRTGLLNKVLTASVADREHNRLDTLVNHLSNGQIPRLTPEILSQLTINAGLPPQKAEEYFKQAAKLWNDASEDKKEMLGQLAGKSLYGAFIGVMLLQVLAQFMGESEGAPRGMH